MITDDIKYLQSVRHTMSNNTNALPYLTRRRDQTQQAIDRLISFADRKVGPVADETRKTAITYQTQLDAAWKDLTS